MKVMILCGGFGTRIRGAGDDVPKPMLPIGDRPILWHVMKIYAAAGFKEFVLCLGYKGNAIRDYFLNYRAHTTDVTLSLGDPGRVQVHDSHPEEDWTVTLAETGLDAMTGARVRKAGRFIPPGEPFMLTYGDGVGDVDLKALLKFHRAHKKVATVTGVRPPGRFGEMDLKGRQVVSFNEKPQTTGGLINGGFFVLERAFLDSLPAGDDLVLEREPLTSLAHKGELMAYEHAGFWMPMDTHREWRLLNDLWEQGKAPWKVW